SIGFVQAPENMLQTAGIQQDTCLFAPRAEVIPLSDPALMFPGRLVDRSGLSQREIVDLPPLFEQRLECLDFSLARIQTVLVSQVHFRPSRFAFSRIASSIMAVWLMPNLRDSSAIKRLASSDNRTLVGWFFIRYIVVRIFDHARVRLVRKEAQRLDW